MKKKIKKDKVKFRKKLYVKLANLQQNLINTAINMINDANLDDDNKDNKENTGELFG